MKLMHRLKYLATMPSRRCVLSAAVVFLSIGFFTPNSAFASDYCSFFGLDSRKTIWFVAQMHLFFGAFVLGVPIFAVIIEYIGYKTHDPKFDHLALEFTSLLSVAYAVTAAIGALLAFTLYGLYPTFMGYLTNVFKETMWIYALLFFGETFTLYIYYYGWDWLKERKEFPPMIQKISIGVSAAFVLYGISVFAGYGLGAGLPANARAFFTIIILVFGFGISLVRTGKGTHIFFGILLNLFGTLIMMFANSWVSFMMSPTGVDAKGVFTGTTWQALLNPLWIPLSIHRMFGNLAFGGFVAGAYAAVKFIGSKTDEERAHYDWMGYISNFVGIIGLLPLPFAGYYLGREVYSYSAVMGNNMMGGDFSWTFIIQAMLVGALFLISNYYLWIGMGRIPGAERYKGYIKFLLAFIVLAFAIWLTPHNMPLTGEEVNQMGGSQYHPTLKYLGLMPAKNAVVNLILIATFFSFLLYKRGNIGSTVPISGQGQKARMIIIGVGILCLWLVGQEALHIFTLDPKTLDLPPDRAVYFRNVAYLLFATCAAIIITLFLTLKDRGIWGQFIYVGWVMFSVVIFLGVYGFVVMEKASPFLRDIAVCQFIQVISCLVLVTTIDIFLFRGAESLGPIRWGKLSVRSQYALLILCIIITLNMGLMGFIRSGLRTDWHIFGVLKDTSEWAMTPSNFTMAQMAGAATFVFLIGVAFMFWISSLAHRNAEGSPRQKNGKFKRRQSDFL